MTYLSFNGVSSSDTKYRELYPPSYEQSEAIDGYCVVNLTFSAMIACIAYHVAQQPVYIFLLTAIL